MDKNADLEMGVILSILHTLKEKTKDSRHENKFTLFMESGSPIISVINPKDINYHLDSVDIKMQEDGKILVEAMIWFDRSASFDSRRNYNVKTAVQRVVDLTVPGSVDSLIDYVIDVMNDNLLPVKSEDKITVYYDK